MNRGAGGCPLTWWGAPGRGKGCPAELPSIQWLGNCFLGGIELSFRERLGWSQPPALSFSKEQTGRPQWGRRWGVLSGGRKCSSKTQRGQAWWCTAVIPALWRLRRDHKFEASCIGNLSQNKTVTRKTKTQGGAVTRPILSLGLRIPCLSKGLIWLKTTGFWIVLRMKLLGYSCHSLSLDSE
jgi:hypothetical protein